MCQQSGSDTHLSLLLIEIVNDDADEKVEGEEGTEDDEDNKVQVHVQVHFLDRLLLHLDTHTHRTLGNSEQVGRQCYDKLVFYVGLGLRGVL